MKYSQKSLLTLYLIKLMYYGPLWTFPHKLDAKPMWETLIQGTIFNTKCGKHLQSIVYGGPWISSVELLSMIMIIGKKSLVTPRCQGVIGIIKACTWG